MKEKQTKSKVSRRKEIIEIRAEINEIETRKTIAKSMKLKMVLWKDKINKPLARLIRKKRERIQISKNRNGKGEVTNESTEIPHKSLP